MVGAKLELNRKDRLFVVAELEWGHVERAWLSEIVIPLYLQLAKLLWLELVDFLRWVLRLEDEHQRANLPRVENRRVSVGSLVEVNHFEDVRLVALEPHRLGKDLVKARVLDLDLQNISVVLKKHVLGHVEGEVGLEPVLFLLVLSDLFAHEVDLGGWRADGVGVDVLVVAEVFVQLLSEVLRCVRELRLQVVDVFMVHFEGKNEPNLLLWPQLIDNNFPQNLLLPNIPLRCLVLRLPVDSGFEFEFVNFVLRRGILNRVEHLEVLANRDFSEGGVEVEGGRCAHSVVAHIAPVEHL